MTLPTPDRVMVIGGCSYVGHLLAPELATDKPVHTGSWFSFDQRDCPDCPWPGPPTYAGDVTDHGQVWLAADGTDAIVYIAEGARDVTAPPFEGSYLGIYNALLVARARAVRRFVLVSTLSVHSRETGSLRFVEDLGEDAAPVCYHPDGIASLVDEWLCRHFSEAFGLSVIVLRIAGPVPDETLQQYRRDAYPETVPFALGARDLYTAVARAVAVKGHTGFDVVNIVSDRTGYPVDLGKAKYVLEWEPQR